MGSFNEETRPMKDRREPFILMVIGPAGAGKTTVADAWARAQAVPTLHLSLDDFRELVKSGYADPQLGWDAETGRQLALARAAIADVARRYLDAGYCCVIDDAVFPDWPEVSLQLWEDELAGIALRPLVLLPSLDAILQRNQLRAGARRLEESMLRVIYEMMEPWCEQSDVPVIDTTDLTVEETVAEIEAQLR